MEHEERLEERVQEIRADADRADRQGDEMEQGGDELGKQVDNVREEFRRKQQSEDVPGAQEPDPKAESHGGSDVDPRPGSSDNPGAADDEGEATGNPPADDSPAADDDDND